VQLAHASEAISAATLLSVDPVALVLLVLYEARTAHPLVRLSLFRNRVFSGGQRNDALFCMVL
jgi:hypothetical protein